LDLHREKHGTLEAVENEQPAGTDQPGNPEEDAGGGKLSGKLSGRGIGIDAGGGTLETHRFHEVGTTWTWGTSTLWSRKERERTSS